MSGDISLLKCNDQRFDAEAMLLCSYSRFHCEIYAL
jgi:hypothetical protein